MAAGEGGELSGKFSGGVIIFCCGGHVFFVASSPTFSIQNKPRGASPGRDYEDGISTKNLVLNILWCRIVGNYI